MNTLLLQILIASSSTFIAIYLLRPFAISIDLVDKPNSRKPHKGSIPLIGGIAMFLALIISILVSSYSLNQYNYFLLATLILVIIGVLDDHQNISVSLRLVFQLLVALIIVTVGDMTINSLGNLLGGGEIILDRWAYFITIVALIGGMNAVNMADGIHGLSGGNSLITFLAMVYLSVEDIYIAIIFCSILPVFLIYNLCIGVSESKRIFMGDAGSMLIGVAIVWTLIEQSQGANKSFAPVTALWLFGVPLIEMATSILRRITSGKSPFKPDLSHSHHLLIRLGIREKNTLQLMLLISLFMAIIGILGELYNVAEWVMLIGFILIFGIYFFSHNMVMRRVDILGK